jgi:chromosome partitioning protein
MRRILVLNPKGGCGKSTLATNIAAWFANHGKQVAIADLDPQQSSKDWLKRRPESAPPIKTAEINDGKLEAPRQTDIIIIDSPAGLHGKKLVNFVRSSETMIMPLMPSIIDIAAAERFIEELYDLRELIKRKVKVATVANRVREDTLSAAKLDDYLSSMKLPGGKKLPFIAMLRNSQNYVRAAEMGLGIFEFTPSKTAVDREQLQPLMSWLSSSRSIPD